MEWTALEHHKKRAYTSNVTSVVTTLAQVFIFEWIFLIIAGNKDTHKSLNVFNFRPPNHQLRIWVVSAIGHFGLGCFGQILGWVDSAYFGGSFRPSVCGGGGGGSLNFSAYVGLDPASTAYPLKISRISGIPK